MLCGLLDGYCSNKCLTHFNRLLYSTDNKFKMYDTDMPLA
jgi:hypothetical protein